MLTGVPPRARDLDIYLFPAIVGGGLGDIEEVLAAGRRLADAGFRLYRMRLGGRPLPRSVEGPWAWPPLARVAAPVSRSAKALTVSPMWGVTAAPPLDGRWGRAGPWAEESAAIERSYGPDAVVHASLEEFARTLTSRLETRERLREGGLSDREIRRRLGSRRTARERTSFRSAYRHFRGFDRANVVSIFAGFRPSRPFGREYPEAVQTGPLWPGRPRRRRAAGRPRRREWIWYASPSSSSQLVEAIDRGLSGLRPPVRVSVRAPRPLDLPGTGRWRYLPTLSARAWPARFARAELRIVTGSRTLLEALELGGPFLYFNGLTGSGRSRRRHRPEKIAALVGAGWAPGARDPVRRDLSAFSRGLRVEEIVRRAAGDPSWRRTFPALGRVTGFPPPYDDAGSFLVRLARDWAVAPVGSGPFVRSVRSAARRAIGLGRPGR